MLKLYKFMAKDKEQEKKYIAEGLRRIEERKEKRLAKFTKNRQFRRSTAFWPDGNSPTGYSQWCEWPEGSTCQYPCNGDC